MPISGGYPVGSNAGDELAHDRRSVAKLALKIRIESFMLDGISEAASDLNLVSEKIERFTRDILVNLGMDSDG